MSFIEKVRSWPLEKRKIIVWVIVAVIAVIFSVWRLSVFSSRISEMRQDGEMIPVSSHQENIKTIKEDISGIKEVIRESREVVSFLKESGISAMEDLLLVEEYIREHSPNPEEDLERLEEDEKFFKFILEKSKNEDVQNNNEEENGE